VLVSIRGSPLLLVSMKDLKSNEMHPGNQTYFIEA
jgi:hypothetical protein